MPLDFRIGYPEKLEVYQKTAVELGLAVDLSGPAYENGQTQIGEGFFEEIFAPALQKAEKDNVPLYCGEYGVIELADHQAMLRWLRDIHAVMDKHGIGRALWNYKEKDFGFCGEEFAGIRDQFISIL